MSSKRRSLTEDELQDTLRLKSVWDQKSKTLSLTQKSASESFGFKNQSAISQYLNGRIPLNMEVAAKFAQFLKVPLSQISPRYSAVTTLCAGDANFLKLLNKEYLVGEDCVLVEMGEQDCWYVMDPAVKRACEGSFAIKQGDGLKLIKFETYRGSYRVYGIDEQQDPVTLPLSAASLITVEGKVLYKISKV